MHKNILKLLLSKNKTLPSSGTLLRGGFEAMRILGPLLINLTKGSSKIPDLPLANSVDEIDIEKREILDRANWLC